MIWSDNELGLTHYILSRGKIIGQTSTDIPMTYSPGSHLTGSQLRTSSAKSGTFVFPFVLDSLYSGVGFFF